MQCMQRMAEIFREQGPEFEWVYHLARAHAAWYACGLARYDSAIHDLHGILDALRGMYMPAYGVAKSCRTSRVRTHCAATAMKR